MSEQSSDAISKTAIDRQKLRHWLILLGLTVIIFGFLTDLLNCLLSSLYHHHVPSLRADISPALLVSKYLRIEGVPQLTHSQGWELGALIWNVGFGRWFYRNVPLPNDERLIRIMLFRISWWIFWCTLFAIVSIWWLDNTHIFFVCGIALVYWWTDRMLATNLADPQQRGNFQECYWLADIPIVAAFVVLVLYQLFRFFDPHDESLHMFFSGAISFQLIASNVIFALIQAGVVKVVAER